MLSRKWWNIVMMLKRKEREGGSEGPPKGEG